MCIAPVFFAGLDATGKVLAGTGVDPLLTTFMRYAVNVTLVTAFINPVTRPGVSRSRRLPLQILRSLLLFGSTALNFLALRSLQLAETISIQFAAPLTVALLAGPLLGEWSSRMRLAAVAAGFVGVLVIESLSKALGAAIRNPQEPGRDEDVTEAFERWQVRPRRTQQT